MPNKRVSTQDFIEPRGKFVLLFLSIPNKCNKEHWFYNSFVFSIVISAIKNNIPVQTFSDALLSSYFPLLSDKAKHRSTGLAYLLWFFVILRETEKLCWNKICIRLFKPIIWQLGGPKHTLLLSEKHAVMSFEKGIKNKQGNKQINNQSWWFIF